MPLLPPECGKLPGPWLCVGVDRPELPLLLLLPPAECFDCCEACGEGTSLGALLVAAAAVEPLTENILNGLLPAPYTALVAALVAAAEVAEERFVGDDPIFGLLPGMLIM